VLVDADLIPLPAVRFTMLFACGAAAQRAAGRAACGRVDRPCRRALVLAALAAAMVGFVIA
jgi:surface antigen